MTMVHHTHIRPLGGSLFLLFSCPKKQSSSGFHKGQCSWPSPLSLQLKANGPSSHFGDSIWCIPQGCSDPVGPQKVKFGEIVIGERVGITKSTLLAFWNSLFAKGLSCHGGYLLITIGWVPQESTEIPIKDHDSDCEWFECLTLGLVWFHARIPQI